MPILKTKVLGSYIEISYQKEDKEKINFLINRLNDRFKETIF